MSEPTILGRWYAEPQDADEAQRVFVEVSQRMERRLRHGGGTLCCRLLLMRAKFWQGMEISSDYESLRHLARRSAHGRVLLELVYGQLLLSRRLAAGITHLERGFRLAANLFTASDYLLVMNRIRLLRQLPLSDSPVKAQPLESLLTSAKVIERMMQTTPSRPDYSHDPKDTYG